MEQLQRKPLEVICGKKLFLKISKYSQENTCVGFSFLIKFVMVFSKSVLTLQKQSSRYFLRKSCSENMHQIYKRTPCRSVISIKLPYNSIEIIFWHGCSPVNLLRSFTTSLEGCFCLKNLKFSIVTGQFYQFFAISWTCFNNHLDASTRFLINVIFQISLNVEEAVVNNCSVKKVFLEISQN